jgi:hypothetical protein
MIGAFFRGEVMIAAPDHQFMIGDPAGLAVSL